MTTIDRKSLPEAINNVFSIIEDYYGEEHTDIQNNSQNVYDILVYWPEVTITNEKDQSHEMKDVYVKIPVLSNGKLQSRFTLGKSTYTEEEVVSHYCHSHVKGIPNGFGYCCLGRGPLVNTCNTLNVEYNEPIWKLFCIELDDFVHTESLAGVPYVKLSSIMNNNFVVETEEKYNANWSDFNDNDRTYLNKFIVWLLSKKCLTFCFTDNRYSIAMNYFELSLFLSQKYKEWDEMNEDGREFLIFKKIKNNDIYFKNEDIIARINNLNGKYMCTFKNERIYKKVINSTETDNNSILLLKKSVIVYIVSLITNYINARYGKTIICPCYLTA